MIGAETLLRVGGTLLGGILGKPKNEWVVPDYSKMVSEAEKAGINPLAVLSAAPGAAMQSQNYMGQAIQEAGLMLAENVQKSQGLARVDQYQRENDALKRQVARLTLQAPVPGIYGQPAAMPSLAEAHGGANGGSGASASSSIPVVLPLGRAGDGDADARGNPVQNALEQDIPAVRAFGRDWFGSGGTSTGQTFEDAIGDPGSWLAAPMIGFDMLAAEIGRGLDYWEYSRHRKAGRLGFKMDNRYFVQEPDKPEKPMRYYGRSDKGMPRRPLTYGGYAP
ncbi:MAG: hypothetical protein ACT4N9_04905 [Paracoccaceae bacterium]